MAEVDPLSRDADIDIGALFSSLRRHWLFIVGGALLMAALAWAICLLLTPDYRAEARLMIEARESIYTRPNGETSAERPLFDAEGVKSQVEVFSSGDLLKKVSDELKLTSNEAFTTTEVKPWTRVLIMLGMRTDPERLTPEERVLQKLRKNMQVLPLLLRASSWFNIRRRTRRRPRMSPTRWPISTSCFNRPRSLNRTTMRPVGLPLKLTTCATVSAMRKGRLRITVLRAGF